MTNEEKAREIELNVYAFEKTKGEFEAPAYRAALEMAEWKDQQFKEYLKKKGKEYGKRSQKWFTIDNMWARHRAVLAKYAQSIINEIINELFKEK